MTDIFLHGKLAKIYGPKFRFSLCRPKDAFSAIETIHEGFTNKIIELSTLGLQYAIIADNQVVSGPEDLIGKRKIKEIHIVPVVYGSGPAAISLTVGILAAVAGAAATNAGFIILGYVLTAVAVAAISYGIQSLLSKPPEANNASSSASTSATSKSFLFTNKENVKQQGNPVPIGYGRLQVGSAVIQETVKSYPNSISTFSEFVSQNTQEGQSQMSLIYNQQL
jgi:predicted phage tail protein